MNNGTKSAISRIWNRTQDVEVISRITGLDVSAVRSYLQTRPGFPGRVFKDEKPKKRTIARRSSEASATQYGLSPKVTLPKLKCLGDC